MIGGNSKGEERIVPMRKIVTWPLFFGYDITCRLVFAENKRPNFIWPSKLLLATT